MKQLIKIIFNYIYKSETIPDEYLYEFSIKAVSVIELCETECITDEFQQLANFVELYWRGKKYIHDDSAERIYQMGQLLSYIKMISIWHERIEKNTSLNEYAIIMNDKYSFFKSIHDESGITHKELANKMHTSVSSLSQFVNKIQGNGFFISRPMGREKHYYLTQKGEKIYELITKKQRTSASKYIKLENIDINMNQNKYYESSYPFKLMTQKANRNIEINTIYAPKHIEYSKLIYDHISGVKKWSKSNLMKQNL